MLMKFICVRHQNIIQIQHGERKNRDKIQINDKLIKCCDRGKIERKRSHTKKEEVKMSVKMISTDKNSKIEVRCARTPLVIDRYSQFALISSLHFSSFLSVPMTLVKCSAPNFSFAFILFYLNLDHESPDNTLG